MGPFPEIYPAEDDTGRDPSRKAANTCRIVCAAAQAMQFWDGVRGPDAIPEEQQAIGNIRED
jgi:hypothetical protein